MPPTLQFETSFARPQPVLALVALVLLFWLIWEGVLFNFRARWMARDLILKRQVRDDRGPVTALWAGRPFEVRLTLRLGSGTLPHVHFEDHQRFPIVATHFEAHIGDVHDRRNSGDARLVLLRVELKRVELRIARENELHGLISSAVEKRFFAGEWIGRLLG